MKKRKTPEWLIATQCQGKHRFSDRGLALRVAVQVGRRKEARTSVYRCGTCGGWHVGGSRGKNK